MNNFKITTTDRIADLDINGILDCDIKAESKQKAINEFKRMTLNEGIVIYDDEFTIKPKCHGCGVVVFPEDDNCCDRCLESQHMEE